jgi:DNA repair protein RecN (Recombination protein N)
MAAAIGRLAKDGQHWARLDPKLAEAVQRLTAMKAEIQDLGETARDLAEKFEADPERLDEVEKRLQLLATLETKYGRPITELIDYRDSLTERERSLFGDETDLAGMDGAIRTAFASLTDAAMTLRKGRAKAARKLAVAVQGQLSDLQMPHAVLTAELTEIDPGRDPIAADVPAAGFDHFEFLLAANPGEPARPLRKVASGGELSRTMLAIKTVLAAHDPVRTLVVFDEIDANVGGRLGDVLGKKLSTLGESHQVICVTHLPQVAGYASRHWTIRKKSTGKSTVTTITELDQPDDRIEELAAMLRGDARSASTRAEAKAMLKSGAKSG